MLHAFPSEDWTETLQLPLKDLKLLKKISFYLKGNEAFRKATEQVLHSWKEK